MLSILLKTFEAIKLFGVKFATKCCIFSIINKGYKNECIRLLRTLITSKSSQLTTIKEHTTFIKKLFFNHNNEHQFLVDLYNMLRNLH